MAEYIDRDLAIAEWYKNSNLHKSAETMFKEIPPADVIERSKIDKAIAEIEELKTAHCVHVMDREDIITTCLEILKRNIGE